MGKLKFEEVSTQEVWAVEVNDREYTVFQDYNANADYNEIQVYDDNGEPVDNELSKRIIDEYVDKDAPK